MDLSSFVPALIAEILSILAPGVLLALIGIVWFHRGPAFPVNFVTTLVLNIALPALLFHTLASADITLQALAKMGMAALVVHLIFTPLMVVLLKAFGKDWRLCIAHVVGNTGNLGLPVCYFAFGDAGLAYAIAFFAVQCLLLFSLGDAALAGSISFTQIFKSPILLAVMAAMVVRLSGFVLPQFFVDTTELLGQLVIPIMLITLGVSLSGLKAQHLSITLGWSLLRTLVAVAIGYFVAHLFQLDGVARGVLILETAMPVAIFHFLLAHRHGHDSTEVSGLILVTHLASIAYLPILLGLVLL